MTLDSLRPGQRGTIESIQGSGRILQRLMEMGIMEGEEVEVLALAPLGDPMEICIRGCNLSLRRSEAKQIALTVTEH